VPKGKPRFGAYGWDATNETWVKIKVSSTGVLNTS